MTAYKEISTYYSDDNKRRAQVVKQLSDDVRYKVSAVSESGSCFTAIFDSVDTAEDFAEDWIMKK